MSRLFISCISDSATERDLYGLFAGFGRLASFDLKKGFGFVHYAHTADADKARRALDKYPFFGRALKVERGRNQDASPPRGGDENGHTILCFRCKREGHRARDCLVLRQNARRRTRSRSRERGADRARSRDRRSPSPPRQRRSPEPRRGPRDDRHEEREEGEMIEATSSDARGPQPADSAEPARDRTATATTTIDPLAHVDDDDEDGERDFRRAFEDTDGSDAEQREKEDRHWRRASDNNANDSRARKAVAEESDARRRPADRRSRERERPQRDGSGREPATRGNRDTRAAEPARPREREREREREAEERERERRRREAERERDERERARERERRQRELEEMRRREGSANGATRRVAAPDRPPLPSSRTTERERERERERGLKRKARSPSPPVRDREPRGSSRHAREEEQQPQKHRRTSSHDNGQQQQQQKQQPSEGPISPVEELLAVPSSPVAHSPVRDAADEPRGTRRDRERDRDRGRDDRRSRP